MLKNQINRKWLIDGLTFHSELLYRTYVLSDKGDVLVYETISYETKRLHRQIAEERITCVTYVQKTEEGKTAWNYLFSRNKKLIDEVISTGSYTSLNEGGEKE